MKAHSLSLRSAQLTAAVTCALGFTALRVSAAPTLFYDAGNPTAQEQYLLERTNFARMNPAAEGEFLANCKDPEVLRYYANYKVDTNAMRAAFASYPARPPLAMSRQLMASAKRHSDDMSTWGQQSHGGSDGSTFDGRIRDTGYAYSAAGENVYAYSISALFGHVGLNADWGVPSLGHRNNIMNFDMSDFRNDSSYLFKEIGISVVPTRVSQDNNKRPFGPLIVTQDFGTPRDRNQAFVLGVVYDDRNGNGAYDEGEGLAGVTVTPDQGEFYTVTGAAGGYTLPMPAGANSLSVTAVGGQLGERRARQFGVTAGTNVKVDFRTQDAPSAALTNVGAVTKVKDAANAGQPGVIQIVRNGGDNSKALTVALTLGGTAVNGVDYAWLPSEVTIPSGADSLVLQVVPLGNPPAGTVKKAKVKIAAGNGYVVPSGSTAAKVKILTAL